MKFVCHMAEIHRSSYYAWLKRPMSKRESDNISLIEKIKLEHEASNGIYGAPRVAFKLRSQGEKCGQKRIAKLMQKEGIFGCAKKKFRAISTTDSRHNMSIFPRIFKIEEKEKLPQAPNQVWVGDMTYVGTQEGWLFLNIAMDLFNRKIVGFSMSDSLSTAPVVWDAMKHGIQSQPEALNASHPNLVAHSDRGCQYASRYYREKLALCGITQSMSRSGNCWDNAYAESFFHTLKVELVYRFKFNTRTEAKQAITKYIDWYNTRRIHSALGYKTPFSYEGKKAA